MKYKGIIFDLDGVLVFTDRYHYLAWKTVADRLGIGFDKTINNRLRGVSRMESLEIILEGSQKVYSQAEKVAFAEEKNGIYKKYLEEMTPAAVSMQTRAALETLKALGVKTAVGSSSKNTRLILEKTGLNGYFDAVIDGNDITKTKPDPEVFIKAREKLSLKESECLVVEDARAGVAAAVVGKMDCAAIGDATRYNIAKYNLKSLSDLTEIVQ